MKIKHDPKTRNINNWADSAKYEQVNNILTVW
jgi:hypothetical protein